MGRFKLRTLMVLAVVLVAGCGVVYDAGSRAKAARMASTLKAGESTVQVHSDWGEPDMRTPLEQNSELWSYVSTPNSNDIAATLLYTSTKPGDTDKFLDLKFVDDKLVSWATVEHTMPAKKGAGFSYGFGTGGGGGTPITHY
ncbi:MAG TPA: hypothetical protein VKS22_11435 [Candidatus Binataceae bacterium]|nr:hypothetical protein [Candidatus Binataceae bacterium]